MAMSKEQDEQATPERWSAKAKTEVILRLFRGESVEAVSREIQVPVHEIETWRKDFLESGQAGLKRRRGGARATGVETDASESGRTDDAAGACGDAPRKKLA